MSRVRPEDIRRTYHISTSSSRARLGYWVMSREELRNGD